MKLPKLLKLSRKILNDKEIKASKRKKCLLELQQKLKKKAKRLEAKYNSESDEECKKIIAKDLAVISAQRKKIIKALQKLSK